jgi:vancomycin permeability regulator SanA
MGDRARRVGGWVRRHRIWSTVIGLSVVAGLVSTTCFAIVRLSTSGRTYSVADSPSAPVALVLGAGLRSDGTPSPYLTARLEDARQLYSLGKVKAILVSGDNGHVDHDEATAMQTWLVQHGVPEAKVVRDHAGFDTWDSCVRAKKIFGVSRAIVVTQAFHLPRALYLCRSAGLDVTGVASGGIGDQAELVYTAREVPAAVKATFEAIFQPDPRFLGEHETGVDTALAGG